MNIDDMPPDELRRRLRDALAEIESLKRRLSPPVPPVGPGTIVIPDLWRGT